MFFYSFGRRMSPWTVRVCFVSQMHRHTEQATQPGATLYRLLLAPLQCQLTLQAPLSISQLRQMPAAIVTLPPLLPLLPLLLLLLLPLLQLRMIDGPTSVFPSHPWSSPPRDIPCSWTLPLSLICFAARDRVRARRRARRRGRRRRSSIPRILCIYCVHLLNN